jgi:DNA-binding CsgD family transcriptional regulator
MQVQVEYTRWLDLVADLTTHPRASFPHELLLAQLSTSFQSLSAWHFQESDGSFRFDLSHPVPGLMMDVDLDMWSRANLTTHPLLCWFQATLDPRPLSVDRVPRGLVPAEGWAFVREQCAPVGMDRQLSIPYQLTPASSRAFVLAQTGEDYSDEDVELARLIQPLFALIGRQTAVLSRAGSVQDPFGLTGRESAVLQLLFEGLTAQGIAHALCISPRTVHSHLAHIYAKLGVSDRLRAVALALELGLLRTSIGPPEEARPALVVYEPQPGQVDPADGDHEMT